MIQRTRNDPQIENGRAPLRIGWNNQPGQSYYVPRSCQSSARRQTWSGGPRACGYIAKHSISEQCRRGQRLVLGGGAQSIGAFCTSPTSMNANDRTETTASRISVEFGTAFFRASATLHLPTKHRRFAFGSTDIRRRMLSPELGNRSAGATS